MYNFCSLVIIYVWRTLSKFACLSLDYVGYFIILCLIIHVNPTWLSYSDQRLSYLLVPFYQELIIEEKAEKEIRTSHVDSRRDKWHTRQN